MPAVTPTDDRQVPSVRIGTRASDLARWQAEWVAAELAGRGVQTELVWIRTVGDARPDPIEIVGQQGVFTSAIQHALRRGEVDLAVHSLKDLPTDPTEDLLLAAVPRRGPAGDALVSQAGTLAEMPPGTRIGTGSARRAAQLLAFQPHLNVVPMRGNVDTRLRKLEAGHCDALVLAEAGLSRLGLRDRISEHLSPHVILPAVGQGALGLEIRAADVRLRSLLAALDHGASHQAVRAERSLLRALRGGCLAPVGAWARVLAGETTLQLQAAVLSVDGRRRLVAVDTAPLSAAEQLGQRVARRLRALGAERLLAAARFSAGA
jgi:hydroxymethylbilane synthase